MNCKLSISKSKNARIFYIYLKVVQMLKRRHSAVECPRFML